MIYAVNKRTKEHRIVSTKSGAEEMIRCYLNTGETVIQADADGWIEWRGSDDANAPLPLKCAHQVKLIGGSVFDRTCPTATNWSRDTSVIYYRPIVDQPASEEVKGWDGEGLPPVGENVLVRRNDSDWLTVEVVAHDDGGIVYRDPATTDHRYKWAIGGGIRPIPTARVQWVDDCVARLVDYYGNPKGAESYIGVARMLHDALASGELEMPGE